MFLLLWLLMVLAPVSQEKFGNSVDYIGWQVMDAYMKDYTNLRPDRMAEQKGYELFKQQFPVDQYDLENPPQSEDVKQVLVNNDWSSAYKSLYSRILNLKSMYQPDWTDQEAVDYLQDQVEGISLRSLGVDDSAYVNLQITKAQLKDEIARYFSGTAGVAEAENATIETQQPAIPVLEAQENNKGTQSYSQSLIGLVGNPDWLSYQLNIISLALILLLLGLLIYLFNMYKKIDERLDRHRKEINEINSDLFVLKRKVSGTEKESRISGRLEALENKMNKLPLEYSHSESKRPEVVGTRTPEMMEEPPRTDEFYLSTPNSDGTFNTSSMSSAYKPTASIYKFVVSGEDGASMASFTVAEQYESVKDALSSPGSYLDPVCESVNAFSPSAKRIVNLRPGRAFKEGDKWIVSPEDKALIRYE